MKQRVNNAPEVVPGDLESPSSGGFGGKTISMNGGGPPKIQPFQSMGAMGGGHPIGSDPKGLSKQKDDGGMQKIAAIIGGVWLLGVFLGYEWAWPLYLVVDFVSALMSIPPLSWIFSVVSTPLSWIFGSGWFSRGVPMMDQSGPMQELRLPPDQVATYVDSYSDQFGDAALIFASHDGYPQIVQGLLLSAELGYTDLIDAADDNGNTALIYAAAKGYRQITAALLRAGADPDIANHGSGGRTPTMEAAGAGHKDIVSAFRLANASLNVQDDFGNTALHYAAYHGHLSVVVELLKGNPRTDITNSYGHTAASYAMSNKHKNIADLINRAPAKNAKAAQAAAAEKDKEKKTSKDEDLLNSLFGGNFGKDRDKDAEKEKDKDASNEDEDDIWEKLRSALKPEKHVKGAAEDLHGRDSTDFAPKADPQVGGMSEAERKSMEEQIAKLKRQHEEAEIKAQKKIVELLEKSAELQQHVENTEREHRELHLNNTEMSLKVQELEAKHSSSETRAMEERQRADRLHQELQTIRLDSERHKSRADNAERERDFHMEASKRHEEHLQRKHQEVGEHLGRLEQQGREAQMLREEVRRNEDEVRRHQDRIRELEGQLQVSGESPARSQAIGSSAGADISSVSTEGLSDSALPTGQMDVVPEAAQAPAEAAPAAEPNVSEAVPGASSERPAASQDSTEM